MKNFFKTLRTEMYAHDLTNADIAKELGRTPMHISRCLNNKAEFLLSEQYKIMRLIQRPNKDLYIVFPENGIEKYLEKRRVYNA